MKSTSDDWELLADYRKTSADDAFRELVQRHVKGVFSTARRLTRNESLAEEATQAVFLLLARKAGDLSLKSPLGAWLYRATTFICRDINKREKTRLNRETNYAMERPPSDPSVTPDPWDKILPLIDQGMSELSEPERQILILRFFESKEHSELAAQLGLSEPAVRKRLSRALERLRIFLSHRGLTVSAMALDSAVRANILQNIPSDLGSQIGDSIAKIGTATGVTVALANGAAKSFASLKFKAIATWLTLATAATAVTTTAIVGNFGWNKTPGIGGSVTLPSGASLELNRVDYSQGSSFQPPIHSSWWKRSLLRVMPDDWIIKKGLRDGQGGMSFSGTPGQKDIYLWTVVSFQSGSAPEKVSMCQILDSQGLPAGYGILTGGLGTGDAVCTPWQLFSIPKSSRQLQAIFYGRKDSNQNFIRMGRFQFENPAFGESTDRPVAPFRREVVQGPISAVVEALREEVRPKLDHFPDWPYYRFHSPVVENLKIDVDDPSFHWRELEFVIAPLHNSDPTFNAYQPRKVKLRDANHKLWNVFDRDYRHRIEDGKWHTRIAGGLARDAEGCGLELQWARTKSFGTHQILDSGEMEIPVGRQRMILHEETAFGSETVEIWGIAGPNAEFKDEMQWTAHYWGDEPEKVITVAIKDQRADSGNLFTLIEALDDRGRPIPLLNEATQEGPNLGLYFKPERDAKSIRLKVAYHPAYWTDFGFVPRTR